MLLALLALSLSVSISSGDPREVGRPPDIRTFVCVCERERKRWTVREKMRGTQRERERE